MALATTYTTKSFLGEIHEKDGLKEWQPSHPFWFQHELRKFERGDKVTCYFTNKKPKRTEQQNRYYWGVYLPLISEETGNDIDDLHILFKGKFLSKGVVEVLGHKVRQARSTTELSTSQFIEYIMRIEEFTGIQAPPTEAYLYGDNSKEDE